MSDSSNPPRQPPHTSESMSALSRTEVDWFDSTSSRRRAAVLYYRDEQIWAITADGERRDGSLARVKISSRLGNVPRTITFADGVLLSARDNDFIDAMLAGQKKRANILSLHYFESQWRAVLICTAAAALFLAAGFTYGIPAAADFAARRIAPAKLKQLGDSIYEQLRKQEFIRPSKLPPSDIALVQTLFRKTAEAQNRDTPYRLYIHDFGFGGGSIANAFALPGGAVIATDKLVNILDDDEITAVFAHELGHIELRHGIRAVIGSAGMLAFLTFAGDISWILSGGAALLNLKYSRDYEREADCFAAHHLQRQNLSPALLGQSLQKLESDFGKTFDSDKTDENTYWSAVLEALSTHPLTAERQNLSEACQNTNSPH